MIRINLLGIKKEVKKKGGAPAVSLEGAKLTGFALAFIGLGLAVLGFHYWQIQKDDTRLKEELRVAQSEKSRLAAVKAQYEQFEAGKRNLQRQIDIIEGLKRQQTGPVELLGQLANTVQITKTMWLTRYDNTGQRVILEGVSISVVTVADFIRNLRNSGAFQSVEIRETSQDERALEVPQFTFEIHAELPPVGAAMESKPRT
jgi:Tfp pilus assembly protein PilN